MIDILRVLSLKTKVLIILLIVILRLKMFFETNNEITIDYIIINEIANELTIDEKLKTRDKRT